jgi:hypothetical protein
LDVVKILPMPVKTFTALTAITLLMRHLLQL